MILRRTDAPFHPRVDLPHAERLYWLRVYGDYRRQIDMQDLKDRLLYRQAVETARCLAEGVLTSVHDANIGSVFGIGFPGWTGGAMQFIYGTGIDAFLHRAEVLASRYGPGFFVAPPVKDAIRKFEPHW